MATARVATSAGGDDDADVCSWSCAMCTFENERDARACAICLTPRQTTPLKQASTKSSSNSSGNSTDTRSTKKQRSGGSAATTTPKRSIQQPLVAVGSSSEKEALRLKKKIEQMKELGIDLPANDMIALLARNCYSVMAAVSAYFEQATASSASATAVDAAAERRVAHASAFFETSFAHEPFRLVGSRTMSATLNRAGVSIDVGDRLVLQAENAGKKRVRPGTSSSAASTSTSTGAASSVSAGVIRVATEHHSLIGRLDRDMETLFQPLMHDGLVQLGGVCVSAPASSQMFASFSVRVFVFVHTKAFGIFDEAHAQFALSDALYAALELLHTDSASAPVAAAKDADAGLEALFSDFLGAGADDDDDGDEEDANGVKSRPADQLAPLLKGITLRDHQRAAVRWMLARENQLLSKPEATASRPSDSSAADEMNPMWETRQFARNGGSFFVNRFEKIASLRRPEPPTPCLGGILADDMGMGKTMMMLALIAHQKHFGARTSTAAEAPWPRPGALPFAPASARRGASSRRPQTLIVCPLSLLHQWKNEVDERFCANALSVYVYYGDDRESSAIGGALHKSDVVLTTYGVLSKEFEKLSSATSALVSRPWHRVILDEAHSIKNRMTTYFRACAALEAEHRWCLTGTPLQNSLDDLFALLCFLQYEPWSRVSWWKRVIATPFELGDEVNALGRLKVILTPILLRRTKHTRDRHGHHIVQLPQKHVELVKLTFSDDERTFYQAVYDKSRAEFNGFVASGTASTSYVAIFALLLRLRQACNHPFLALGRNFEEAQREDGDSSSGGAAGSSASTSLFRPQPGESMASYYSRISAQLQQDLQHSASSSASDTATARLADAQRSSSSSAAEQPQNSSSSSSGSRAGGLTKSYIASVLAQVEEGLESHECPVCLDPPVNGVLTACAHVLCEQCLRDSIANDPESGCPVCRAPVEMAKVFVLPAPGAKASEDAATETEAAQDAVDSAASSSDSSDAHTGGVFVSTKLAQLLRDLTLIRRENEQSDGAAKKRKVVVFSQWTYMLEMIGKLLQANGFAHCTFHGSMPQDARERVLTRFAKDPALDVLVISLKAGGVGLNLTCASVVILMDPWWNPGVEDQAIDRVHRLGQDQDVIVKRYVVDDTVEDMILQLQERKEKLAKHVLVASKSGDDKRSERLSLEDLKSFFR